MKKLIVILSALFLSANVLAEGANKVAKAQLDKAWGLLLGDVFTMIVDVPVPLNEVDVDSLPHIDKRFGDWLLLRQISLTEPLVLEFQVVNVAPTTTEVMTPPLSFRLVNGERVDIEQRKFSISPIIPLRDKESSTTLNLKPARSAEQVDTTELKQQLTWTALFALFMAVVLVIWNIGWRPRNRQPFAEALHGLRMLRWHHDNDPQQAIRLVHKAFNRTAAKTVVYSELQQLFVVAPWLKPLETEITTFFEQSSQHFFTANSASLQDVKQLKQLMKACRSKEKLT